ncbi:glycosyltransferase family 2 protein [Sulfurimonas sp. HSL-1716]|uniref:glycosyltransferase family 2 protein n=1 Tax=Hydrocurvibacter sulfurireducens TaxID=3131937 RepID=UPI0031F89E2C
MNEEILVSIITPMYNAEKYILQTVKSVIDQTYQNWEMLIVDNCSLDESRTVVENIADPRIKLIKLEYNSGGPARPRNIGLENAKGEYIAFLDADDVWLPEKLEKQLAVLSEFDNIDIVHSLAYTIDIHSNKIGKFNNQKTFNKLKYLMNDFFILTLSNYININTAIMRNNSKIKFREDPHLVALEDWAFWIDNVYSGKKPYLMNLNLIDYRIDINSISDRKTDKSYRKAFYLYALLLNEEKISLGRFLFNSTVNLIKIIFKNVKSKY